MTFTMEKFSLLSILIHGLLITRVSALIDDSGCGSTKGCFREPSGCTAADCNYLVTWEADTAAGNVKMELQGKSNGWVAVGLSKDQRMGDDSVYECLSNDGNTVIVQSSYNGIYKGTYTTLGQVDISATSGSFVNGVISCSFTRPITPTDSNVFAADQPYYLLLGGGPGSMVKAKHNANPAVSDKMVDISTSVEDIAGSAKDDSSEVEDSNEVEDDTTDTTEVEDDTTSVEPVGGGAPSAFVRAHGLLMMSLFVCAAILMARHY